MIGEPPLLRGEVQTTVAEDEPADADTDSGTVGGVRALLTNSRRFPPGVVFFVRKPPVGELVVFLMRKVMHNTYVRSIRQLVLFPGLRTNDIAKQVTDDANHSTVVM